MVETRAQAAARAADQHALDVIVATSVEHPGDTDEEMAFIADDFWERTQTFATSHANAIAAHAEDRAHFEHAAPLVLYSARDDAACGERRNELAIGEAIDGAVAQAADLALTRMQELGIDVQCQQDSAIGLAIEAAVERAVQLALTSARDDVTESQRRNEAAKIEKTHELAQQAQAAAAHHTQGLLDEVELRHQLAVEEEMLQATLISQAQARSDLAAATCLVREEIRYELREAYAAAMDELDARSLIQMVVQKQPKYPVCSQ